MRGPFTSLFERRSVENPSTPLSEWAGFADAVTAAGLSIGSDKALSVPEVFACVQILGQDVGRCPLKLRRINADGSHTDAVDVPMYEILADLPNPETTAFTFRDAMQRNLLRYQAAYAEIVRNSRGEVISLWPLDPRAMTVSRNAQHVKTYTYRPAGGGPIMWTFNPSTPPILELNHPSPLVACRDLIGLAYALDLFGAKFFAHGARPSGTLEAPAGVVLGDEVRARLRGAFEKMYSGAENAGKVALLEGGITFKPITVPNDEAQYNETRKMIRSLICGIFRMPPHKVADLDRATFSNIEQQSIDYVTGTLDPFLVAWEQAIRRDLLSTRQFPSFTATFDREALIKADVGSLYTAYAVARQNGWMSANDILQKLGQNPIAGVDGSAYLVNGSMIPASTAATATGPSTGARPAAA